MNVLHQPPTITAALAPSCGEPGQRFLLAGVSWEGYEKILEALTEHHVRITYDRGMLELMSPLPPHELYKKWFSHLFVVLALELHIRVRGCGSTTFRKQDLERGLEPDECYYLANIPHVRDWRSIDLAHDPPPDLAIEVDVTSSSLDRLSIYAGLGVPEVWRFDGDALQAYRLVAGPAYQACPASPALPFLPLPEMVPLLQQSLTAQDDLVILQALQSWVRQRVLPLRQAATGGAPGTP
jgi:Uma2 family endonuclease